MIEILQHISTPRLNLKFLNVGDCAQTMEARAESFSELKYWDIMTPETSADQINLQDEIKMCEWRIDRINRGESIFYNIFTHKNNRLVGGCALTKCDWNKQTAMLGFWLRTSETGNGYATEAASALIDYGINGLGLKIWSMHGQGNDKSRNILLKLGFKDLRVDKNCHHLPNGNIVDEYHYELNYPPTNTM